VSAILSDIHAVMATYPARLRSGLTWKDSAVTTACIGKGVPTAARVVRLYQVLGETTHNKTGRAILIQRLDSTYISGEGTEENHQIHLEGTGSSISKIYIDLNTGLPLSTEVSQVSDITVNSSGKARRFSQGVTQRLDIMN
jgi:hypothetical protein